jgi:hypothetical protein
MKPMPTLPDFDTLVALNTKDPAAFEAYRHHLLQSFVDRAPEQHRPALQALVLRMEAVRAEAKTPLEATISATKLMLESTSAMRDAMGRLIEHSAALQTEMLLTKFRL